MKKNIILLLSTITIIAIVTMFLEGTVRYYYPEINHQDTELSLFEANVFGQSVGWKSNSRGESFGVYVDIDENGFRTMTVPDNYEESWIVLGDSVGFGVGVKEDALFSQLLQNKLVDKRIWNTSVVGYSLPDYRNVIRSLLLKRQDITKVILIYCLNDIYGNLTLKPKNITAKEKVLYFLKRNSKLYMLLKKHLFDRSKVYALHDIKMYSSINPVLNDYLDILKDIDTDLKEQNIDFTVIVLPYEYQLRMKSDEYLKPQQVLSNHLKKNNINFINAFNYFKQESEAVKYYLYSDPMHLSEYGHKKLFELIYSNLSTDEK